MTNDLATFDLKSGNKNIFTVTGGLTGFAFSYSGQEIFLNGVNLVSGYDFVLNGGILNLTSQNTGISGYIFEYPIVLTPRTGTSPMITGSLFWRNTSNIYLNGVRQPNYRTYIEGGIFDMLSGQSFNNSNLIELYDNDDFYWE